MLYSAVSQPCWLSLRNFGVPSCTLALQMTFVSPHVARTDPSACFVKLGRKFKGRKAFSARLFFLCMLMGVLLNSSYSTCKWKDDQVDGPKLKNIVLN